MWQASVALVLQTVSDIDIETFIHFELIVLLELLNNNVRKSVRV